VTEQQAVLFIGIGCCFAIYTLAAWQSIRVRGRAMRAYFLAAAVFTQFVPVLVLLHPRSTALERGISLVEVILAAGLAFYLRRVRRAT
jgi:predicted neutral ceramidase superfamily lipid hydrolase